VSAGDLWRKITFSEFPDLHRVHVCGYSFSFSINRLCLCARTLNLKKGGVGWPNGSHHGVDNLWAQRADLSVGVPVDIVFFVFVFLQQSLLSGADKGLDARCGDLCLGVWPRHGYGYCTNLM